MWRGRRWLPELRQAPYSHLYSPRIYTQPQLLACLVLKKFYKTDYRGIVASLRDHSDLREILGLAKVPHYTTLQKASARLLAQPIFRRVLHRTVRRVMRRKKKIRRAAADSSGFDCGHASRYYVSRRAKGQSTHETPAQSTFYHRFVKLELVIDTASHMILGARKKGPGKRVRSHSFTNIRIATSAIDFKNAATSTLTPDPRRNHSGRA